MCRGFADLGRFSMLRRLWFVALTASEGESGAICDETVDAALIMLKSNLIEADRGLTGGRVCFEPWRLRAT